MTTATGKPRESRLIDTTNITPEQAWVVQRMKRMIGTVLTQAEAALPPGQQLDNLKKLMNVAMYDCLTDIIRTVPEPYGLSKKNR